MALQSTEKSWTSPLKDTSIYPTARFTKINTKRLFCSVNTTIKYLSMFNMSN